MYQYSINKATRDRGGDFLRFILCMLLRLVRLGSRAAPAAATFARPAPRGLLRKSLGLDLRITLFRLICVNVNTLFGKRQKFPEMSPEPRRNVGEMSKRNVPCMQEKSAPDPSRDRADASTWIDFVGSEGF